MPAIGRPDQGSNPFANIKKNPGPAVRRDENVGDDFVYKARALHYDKNKKQKGIYGNASKKQIAELRDEGIETQIFPWIEDNNN